MRTRERLSTVLQSANATDSTSPFQAEVLGTAGHLLNLSFLRRDAFYALKANLAFIKNRSASEHFRELAAEALHYLTEDAKA